jgi:hypothetical protein
MKYKIPRLLIGLILIPLIVACNLLNTFFVSDTTIPCPVSPRLPDHPVAEQMVAPAGEFPVWFVTFQSTRMSDMARSRPPYNGGSIRKSLVVVSTELSGDLVIIGHQLDGDATVLFLLRIDHEVANADGSTTIIYSPDDLSDRMVLPNAHITSFGTWAKGYATHPWAAYYPVPGCYQLIGSYDGHTSHSVVQVLDA